MKINLCFWTPKLCQAFFYPFLKHLGMRLQRSFLQALPVGMSIVRVQTMGNQELGNICSALESSSMHGSVSILLPDFGVSPLLQKKLHCCGLSGQDAIHQRCLSTLTNGINVCSRSQCLFDFFRGIFSYTIVNTLSRT